MPQELAAGLKTPLQPAVEWRMPKLPQEPAAGLKTPLQLAESKMPKMP